MILRNLLIIWIRFWPACLGWLLVTSASLAISMPNMTAGCRSKHLILQVIDCLKFAFAISNGLVQVVSEPTCTTNSGKEVQLDLMFVNQPLIVQSCTTLTPLPDHRPTLLQLSGGGPQHARSNPYFASDSQHANYEGLPGCLMWFGLEQATFVHRAICCRSSVV